MKKQGRACQPGFLARTTRAVTAQTQTRPETGAQTQSDLGAPLRCPLTCGTAPGQ
jgi:hypothetical protein